MILVLFVLYYRVKSHLQKFRTNKQKSIEEYMAEYKIGMDTFKECSGKSKNFRDGKKEAPSIDIDEVDGIKDRIICSSKIAALTSGDAAAYLTMMDKATLNEKGSPSPTSSRPLLSREQAYSSRNVSSNTSISSSRHHLIAHGSTNYPPSKRRKTPGEGLSWEASVCSNPPMFMSRYANGVGPPTIELPALSEAEKESPLGANLCYVMGMFFSLNERISEQRRSKPASGPPLAIDFKNQNFPTSLLPVRPRHNGQEYEHHDAQGSSLSTRIEKVGHLAQLQSREHHHQHIFRRQDPRHHQLQEDYNPNLFSIPKALSINLTTNREHHPALQTQEQLAANNNNLLPAYPHHANGTSLSSPHEHHPISSSECQYSDRQQEYIDQDNLTPVKHNYKMTPAKNNSSSGSHPHDCYYHHTNIPTTRTTTKSTSFEEIQLQTPMITNNTSVSCDDLEQLEPYYIYQPAAGRSCERTRSLSVSLHSLDFREVPPLDDNSSSSGSSIGSELREVIESNSLYKGARK